VKRRIAYSTMTTTPRPVTELTEQCEQCRARDLAADPDAPSSRRDCTCPQDGPR
jgi:hypothetical protein